MSHPYRLHCRCLDCLEHWLYYGHPTACPFKPRQRVRIINPHTARVEHTGTIYRLQWVPRVSEAAHWGAGVKVGAKRYLVDVKHLVLAKPAIRA
jgi:hypothetical protein